MRRLFAFLSMSLVGAFLLFAGSEAASADILISINKLTQHMTVTVNGVPKYHWKVSTGRIGYSTPSGTFHIFRMEKVYASKEWDDAPMPDSMFFTARGHAIHGSYDVGHLGLPVSHGCVRLSPQNAATLFALVQSQGMWGTTVIVSGPSLGLGTVSLPDFGKMKLFPNLSKHQFADWLNLPPPRH